MKNLLLVIVYYLCIINITKSENIDEKIKKLEKDLINSYIKENNTEIDNILDEIMPLDESIYKRDNEIINYWRYIDDKMTIYMDNAPNYLPKTADHAFVVLGFVLNDDGSLKDEAKGRCEVAFRSAKKYPKSKIYITGGGTAKYNKSVTEAGQMKEYLLEKGLDPKRIITEDKAMDTVQNAKNTVKQLYQNHIKSITVITSDYHIRRSSLLFKGEIMIKADIYDTTPIEIIQNAVYKTGRKTEGKYYEGYYLSKIMGFSIEPILLLASLPQMILNFVNDYYFD